ncbi:MAG: hypothetical protein JW902_11345, partial [Syntrophaceae bacterium]|nr:hypothetical protein [Syntrophaceae bacterium]
MDDPSGEHTRKVFRSKYMPGFLATLFLCGLIELVFMNYERPHSLPQLGAAFLFIAVFTGLIVLLYKVIVTREGIYAYTWYGRYRYYRWEEIVSVRRINIPGFCYLRMIPQKGAVIWVPQFLRYWQDFREVVVAYIDNSE